MGKPGDALKDIVLDKYNIKDPKRVLFIGDTYVFFVISVVFWERKLNFTEFPSYIYRLEQDIGFGTKCGFKTLLVMTGSATKMDLLTHPKKQELPDYYLENIGDFSKVFDDMKLMNKI